MYVELLLSFVTILVLLAAVWLGCDFQYQWMMHDDGHYHLLPTGKSLRPIMPTTFRDWEELWHMSMDTRQPRRTYLLTETDKKLLKRAEEPVMWDVGLEESIVERKERADDARKAKTRMEKVKSALIPVGTRSGMSQVNSARGLMATQAATPDEASADQFKTAALLVDQEAPMPVRTPNTNISKKTTANKKALNKAASKRNYSKRNASRQDTPYAATPRPNRSMWRMFTDDKQNIATGNCGTMSTTRTNEEGRMRRKMMTMTARTEDVEERWRMKTKGA